MWLAFISIVFLELVELNTAFYGSSRVPSKAAFLFASKLHEDDNAGVSQNSSRRNFIAFTSSLTSALPFLINVQPSKADEDKPICVIGANGRTGTQCVMACLDKSIPVRATSRTGVYNGQINNQLLSTMLCDVTDASTIRSAVQGSRAVIFAASASKQGGTPAAVDNLGLVNVAQACLDNQVPQLVIVSSGSVTKPDSPVYKFLNLFGNIMEEKIKGEDAVRALYKNVSGLSYTVIRPGGLTEEPSLGVAALELNQGDTKSGRISRADVGLLCIESTFYPQLTGGTTFECYNADTGKPLAAVGISNILKAKNKDGDSNVYLTGKEHRGDTWEALFVGLDKDV